MTESEPIAAFILRMTIRSHDSMILSEERKRQIEELRRLGEERGFTIAYQEEQKKAKRNMPQEKGSGY